MKDKVRKIGGYEERERQKERVSKPASLTRARRGENY